MGILSAAHCWWTTAVDHFSISGHRNAVHIELVCSRILPDRSLSSPLRIERTVPRGKVGQPGVSITRVAPDISPQPLSLNKPPAVPDFQRPLDQQLPSDETGVRGELVDQLYRSRDRSDTAHAALERPPREFRLSRHELETPSLQTTAIVKNTAGIENRTSPDFLGNRPPAYPVEAIRKRLEGTVLLRLYIDAAGRVEQVEVAETSGHAILDQSAVKAVRSWRGRPAHRGNLRVATVELLPVHFRL